jgi:hypothetical protein
MHYILCVWQIIVGECESKPCLVLILWIAETYYKVSVFFTANVDSEIMYCV